MNTRRDVIIALAASAFFSPSSSFAQQEKIPKGAALVLNKVSGAPGFWIGGGLPLRPSDPVEFASGPLCRKRAL
jgi:hypothetical protein